MIALTITKGFQAGQEFSTEGPVVRIGRGSGNDLVLQDTQASRHHAQISHEGYQCVVQDLGSTNGTFVNNERITAPRALQPGDQIKIGETILTCQQLAPAAAPDNWESQLWAGGTEVQTVDSRQKTLVWGLVGLLAVLLVAVAVVVALMLRDGEDSPTAVTVAATEMSSEAIVIAPTETSAPVAEGQPTATLMVDVPTVEPVPTVEIEVTAPAVKPPAAPKPPVSMPVSPEDLEKLPAVVAEVLGDVPPDQLPEAIAGQIQSLPQEQVQQMIGALFPGVAIDELPSVVAASFPGLSEQDIQGLLGMVFPGQAIQLPEMGPVGGRIALGIYDRTRSQYDLHLANATGGQPVLLAENATDPGFSSNGTSIVYHSLAPDKAGLRLMKIDGSDDQALTSVASDRNPRFSPDGTRILFSNVDNNTLHTINRDGTDRRGVGQGKFPDWSPDGQQIVFQGCVSGGKCGLIVANADGSNPRQITTHANDTMPRWRYGNIAFLSDRDGNFEIYVINPDGSWLRRITNNTATDIMPAWDPNGVRLAFRSDRGGDPAVYVTSGIGGGDFKQFSAAFGPDWTLAGIDWGR